MAMHRRQLRGAFAAIDLTPGQGPPVFVVLRARSATEPVRFTEILPGGFSVKQTWFELEFCEGHESLCERLKKLAGRDHKRLVVEIRDLATMLAVYLPQTPVMKRGRQ
jgi:hypothetical protein